MHRLKPPAKTTRALAARLKEVARIGALFVEGDFLEEVFASGRDWKSGDDINFAHAPYIELKRTVLRIERIADFRCFATLALIRRDDPAKAEAVVCGMRNPFGIAPVPMTPAMLRCVKKGEITSETESGRVRAFAPIANSDGETVGFLMVHTG
ncbi:MAG TPA: hypothetical protein VNE39_11630 [Planctomycetota bacterium]|nr:hypothetical protein [Planctomycetota bacterium]